MPIKINSFLKYRKIIKLEERRIREIPFPNITFYKIESALGMITSSYD